MKIAICILCVALSGCVVTPPRYVYTYAPQDAYVYGVPQVIVQPAIGIRLYGGSGRHHR